MEDCPATPLILTGRDSKSPLHVALSSPESDGMKSPSPGSPDSRCVICLGRLQNKSFTDSCLHQFCFQCLLQWSKIKAECPLCKQPFKSIIHNVRSNLDYDQYHVEHGEPRYVLSDLMHSYNFDLIPVDRRFRYRSTMTSEYFRELAESFLAHTRRIPEDSYQINPLVPVDPAPASNVRRSNRLHSNSQYRSRQRGTTDFRRNIYAQDLWVQNLTDISGRFRECTPQFYRENPAQIHRIIPWLNREVNVLLSDCESHAAYVLSRIITLLTQHPIRSREFREQTQSYFGDRTDHFIHELYTFARSVYDIAGFDQNAVYGTNPNYATEVQEISSSSDNDSDIEVLETVKIEGKKSKKSRQGLKKLILKRATNDESKSDEPVAGPSGVSSSRVSESIEICESDAEEVKVLHYVKPEPEVVTLSSGEEAPGNSDPDNSNGDYVGVIHSECSKSKSSSSHDDDRKRSRTRSGKGKCKSNGFGLKGRQKKKYIKSRKHRSSSTSSISSSSSNSTSSSSSSSSSTSTSTNTNSNTSTSSSIICSNFSYESRKWKSDSSLSSRSSHRSSSKSKKKKARISRKKFKRKYTRRSNHRRYSSSSDSEKKKRRVKSCVVVPSWSCDSSPSSYKHLPMKSSDEPKSLKSYWSIPINDRPRKRRHSFERKPRRKYRESSSEERSKKRYRSTSSSSERSVERSINGENKTNDSKISIGYGNLLPGEIPSSSEFTSSSSSSPLTLNSSSQNFVNTN